MKNFAPFASQQRALIQSDVKLLCATQSQHPQHILGAPISGTVVEDQTVAEQKIVDEVISCVNDQICTESHGRLFAVIYIHGKQFKVTPEDLIVVQSNMPVDIGDSLRLEKVLMVGSRDFSLLGRPTLSKDLVRVEATVVEKTLSHEIRHFLFKQRSRFHRSYFFRYPYTVLRINSIQLLHPLNQGPSVEGVQDRLLY
ncbi:large ribosomal subunit protein bL21m-like [Ornithodoros turicata]